MASVNDPMSFIMEQALDHEEKAKFSLISAQLIGDEMNDPQLSPREARDMRRRHAKHIKAAKYHVKQVEKLERLVQKKQKDQLLGFDETTII